MSLADRNAALNAAFVEQDKRHEEEAAKRIKARDKSTADGRKSVLEAGLKLNFNPAMMLPPAAREAAAKKAAAEKAAAAAAAGEGGEVSGAADVDADDAGVDGASGGSGAGRRGTRAESSGPMKSLTLDRPSMPSRRGPSRRRPRGVSAAPKLENEPVAPASFTMAPVTEAAEDEAAEDEAAE